MGSAASRGGCTKTRQETSPRLEDHAPWAAQREPNTAQGTQAPSDTFQWECEISFQGGKDLKELFKNCTKNPGHLNFIPIQEFLNPENEWCDPGEIDLLCRISDRTVKIMSVLVSNDRPNVFKDTDIPYPYSHLKGKNAVRCGTGYIRHVDLVQSSECPCKRCIGSSQPETEYYEIEVYTASHVVYNEEEAKESVIELFYDSEDDRTGVRKLRGVKADGIPENEWCRITGCTHDKDLVDRIGMADNGVKTMSKSRSSRPHPGWIISHPHGRSKHVSQGTLQLGGRAWCGSLPVGFTHYRLPKMSLLSRIFKRNNKLGHNSPLRNWQQDPCYRYYFVPRGTRWIFPEGFSEEFHHQMFEIKLGVHDDDEILKENHYYIKAPPGTLIKLREGGKQVPCPDGAELDVRYLFDHFFYDISTCPGSSGAPILGLWLDGEKRVSCWVCHAAGDKEANRSSIDTSL